MMVQKAINLNGPKLFCLNPVTFSRGLYIVDIGMSKLTVVTLTKMAIHYYVDFEIIMLKTTFQIAILKYARNGKQMPIGKFLISSQIKSSSVHIIYLYLVKHYNAHVK